MKLADFNTQTLDDVKDVVSKNIGNIVSITEVNKQGKKLKIYKGTILSAYANLFLVKVQSNGYCLNKTFSYTDFITNEKILEIIQQESI